jgi:hypothetical protein
MSDNLGIDYGWLQDCDDERMGVARSPQYAYCQSIARRLLEKKGRLPYWSKDYGGDIKQFLLSDAPDHVIASTVEESCYADERTELARCTVTRVDGALQLSIDGETAAGPFAFVLTAGEASVKLVVTNG